MWRHETLSLTTKLRVSNYVIGIVLLDFYNNLTTLSSFLCRKGIKKTEATRTCIVITCSSHILMHAAERPRVLDPGLNNI